MIVPMSQRCIALCLLAVVASTMGCSMCANPHDRHYPAYGSMRPRVDDIHGRVGSVFSDASGQQLATESPTPAEIIEPESIIDEGQIIAPTEEMPDDDQPFEMRFETIQAPAGNSDEEFMQSAFVP